MNRKLDRPCEATPPVDENRKRIDTHVDKSSRDGEECKPC